MSNSRSRSVNFWPSWCRFMWILSSASVPPLRKRPLLPFVTATQRGCAAIDSFSSFPFFLSQHTILFQVHTGYLTVSWISQPFLLKIPTSWRRREKNLVFSTQAMPPWCTRTSCRVVSQRSGTLHQGFTPSKNRIEVSIGNHDDRQEQTNRCAISWEAPCLLGVVASCPSSQRPSYKPASCITRHQHHTGAPCRQTHLDFASRSLLPCTFQPRLTKPNHCNTSGVNYL